MKRCLATLIALAATLLLLVLPAAMAATNAHRGGAAVHVRHQTIHRPAHRRGRCARHKKNKHAKRASCRKHRKAARTHRHKRHKPNKRLGASARGSHPATASRDCPNANLTPKPGNVQDVVAATLCLVNDERARFGVAPLSENPRLASAAASHSRDMDERHYFEHVSPGGQTLMMRVQESGFIPTGHSGYTIGENIAWGTLWLGTPHSIVKAWMDSPGHRANILNRSYRYTGIGIDADLPRSMSGGQAGGMYTQDFGAILG